MDERGIHRNPKIASVSAGVMLSRTHGFCINASKTPGYHRADPMSSSAASRSDSSTPSATHANERIPIASAGLFWSSQSPFSKPAIGLGGAGVLVGLGAKVGRGVRVGVARGVAVGFGRGVNVGAGVFVGGAGGSVGTGVAVGVGGATVADGVAASVGCRVGAASGAAVGAGTGGSEAHATADTRVRATATTTTKTDL